MRTPLSTPLSTRSLGWLLLLGAAASATLLLLAAPRWGRAPGEEPTELSEEVVGDWPHCSRNGRAA